MNYKYIELQGILAVCGHLLLVFMVINIFEKQKNIALKQLEEKNKLLEEEKKRSDTLLLNILPYEIAEELKRDGKSKTRQYDQVSVLFTDFVSFTSVSEQLSPGELVDEINTYFSAFDAIIEKNGLEKIKTIGDAYLAVCGMPNETAMHAHNTVNAAIEIMQFMNRHETEGGKFKIRIGINSGTVVAGIVGIKKFAYDIWGDTVNTAARMEEKSKSGKINISGSTFELVKNDFAFDYRGKIEAKNKGEIDMYFIESTAPVPVKNDQLAKIAEGQMT